MTEILAFLLKNKMIDGNDMTVTGRTLGENLEQWTHKYGELDARQDVIRPLDKPIKSTGHIRYARITCLPLRRSDLPRLVTCAPTNTPMF